MRASLSASAGPASFIGRRLLGLTVWLALLLIRGGVQREPAAVDAAGPTPAPDPAGLFADAVRAGAGAAVDWMWLYAQMTGSFERLYCLEKALAQNPRDEAARDRLHELARGA